MSGSGADDLANQLLISLVAGKSFAIPDIKIDEGLFTQPPITGEVFEPIPKPTTDDLVALFGRLMDASAQQLDKEFRANRISGAEYTKAFIGMIQGAQSGAIQFLLGKDTSHWQALLVQRQVQAAEIERVKARIELETARFQFASIRYQAFTAEAGYALQKMKLASEDVTFANLRKQGIILDLQAVAGDIDNRTKTYTLDVMLPTQRVLLAEQIEVQRAQTLDQRTDGQFVVGSVGKQKDLYSQQIVSYKRDSEMKVAKMWVDAWITQKTMDEGLLPPEQFQNVKLNDILSIVRANVALA